MDDFYAARSRLIPPLPWPTFAPPFSLIAYGEILGREAGHGPIEPMKLVVPMLERFIATDRGFAKARRSHPKREMAKQGP